MSVAFTAVFLKQVMMPGSGSIFWKNSMKEGSTEPTRAFTRGPQQVWEAEGGQPKEMAFPLLLEQRVEEERPEGHMWKENLAQKPRGKGIEVLFMQSYRQTYPEWLAWEEDREE